MDDPRVESGMASLSARWRAPRHVRAARGLITGLENGIIWLGLAGGRVQGAGCLWIALRLSHETHCVFGARILRCSVDGISGFGFCLFFSAHREQDIDELQPRIEVAGISG